MAVITIKGTICDWNEKYCAALDVVNALSERLAGCADRPERDAIRAQKRAAVDTAVEIHAALTAQAGAVRDYWARQPDSERTANMVAPGLILLSCGPTIGGHGICIRHDDTRYAAALRSIVRRYRDNGGRRENAPPYMLPVWDQAGGI